MTDPSRAGTRQPSSSPEAFWSVPAPFALPPSAEPESGLPVIAPKGADTEAALRDWLKEEIKTTSKQAAELGKYLFSTSSGAVALLATLSKIGGNVWAGLEWFAVGLFMFSGGIGLVMMLPRSYTLSARFDIAEAANRRARGVSFGAYAWAGLFALGVVLAGLGLFLDPAKPETAAIPGGLEAAGGAGRG